LKKLAIIGMGPHGLRMLKSALRIEALTVVAVVDRDSLKLEHLDLEAVPHKLNDLAMLWQTIPDLDALLIATNGPSHAPIAIEAMQHGVKFLLVTKPFACKLADADQMQAMAKEKDVRMVVDHGLRHDETYEWLVGNIQSARWGALRSVYIQRPGIGLGCLGVHSFDLANQIMGAVPVKVTGWLDEPIGKNPRGAEFVDPGGLVVLDYGNGRKAIVSQIEDGSGPMSVEINCNYAKIRVDEKFRVLELVEKEIGAVAKPGKPVPLTRTENPQGRPPSHDIFDLMEKVIRELVSDDAAPKADAAHGIRSLEILVAAYISHQNGNMPVSLPLTEEADRNRFIPVT
jgi:predicted dehydrogenase